MRKLVVTHLVGNAVLLGLAYYWLGVGESDAMHLALSGALILVIAAGFAWLHGAALSQFRTGQALRFSHLLPLMILAVATAAIYFAAEYWNPASENRINRTASYLTLTFQTPVRPASVERVFGSLWWVVEWMLIPLLLLPAASGIASRGWAGFREFASKRPSWSYWIAVPALLVLGLWLPFRLMSWTPAMSNFALETLSLTARFGLAYLLFVAAGLLLAFVSSRGRPLTSHPSTAVSP